MSSVDNRIVKLKFDNSQFEANVSKSMSTLDKLKEKLNFKDSAKDIENLQTAVNKVDFSAMQSSLQFLEKRFSATGEFIYKIWDQITDKAINAFKRVESATIGQIKSGGWARALNIANAQFQTAGLGASWDAIKAAADYAVTDTAYGLDEAAKTASQLLASGIDYQKVIEKTDEGGLTQMHKALRAISGVAAMTNSSYSEIANIFTRIAGSGRVFAIDLNSIAARGLNAAAVLAKAFNTTEAEIRDMVKYGEISFNDFAMAMDEAYGEHAKQANETFQGSMSNMRAALSRIGAIFAQPMIDKTNRFFNAITGRIKEVQRALSDVKLANDEVSPRFATHFAEAWDAAVTAAVNFTNAIDLSWLHDVADTMDEVAIKMKRFFDWVNEGFASNVDELDEAEEATEESLKNMVASQAEYKAAMTIMFKDKSLTGNKRVKWLEQQGLNPKRVQKYIDSVVAAGWNVNKASIKVSDSIDDVKEEVVSLESEIEKLPISIEQFNNLGAIGQEEFLKTHKNLVRAYRDTDAWMEEITAKERDAYDTARAFDAVNKEYAKIMGLPENQTIYDFARMDPNMKKAIYQAYPQLEETFHKVYNESYKFEGVAAIFQNLSGSIANIKENLKAIIRSAKNAFQNVFNVDTVLPGIIEFTDKVYELTDALLITEGGEIKLQTAFEILFTVIRGGIGLFGRFIMKVMDVIIWFANLVKGTREVGTETKKTNGIIESLWKIIKKTAGSFKDLILNFGDFIDMVKNTEGVKRLREAFAGLGRRFRKDIDPASDALADFADSYEGIKMEDIADGIGWVADKIAWLVEQIPKLLDIAEEAFGVVSGFVTEVWDKISGWFDGKDAGSIFDEVKSRLVGAWEYTKDIGDNIGTFFTTVWEVIKNSLKNLDFDTIQDVSKAAALMFGIYELLRLLHSVSGLLIALKSVPTSISTFFGSLTDVFKSVSHGFENFGIAAVIQSVAWLFISIAVFLGIVASINEEALYKATGVAVLVGIFIYAIVKLLKNASGNSKIITGNTSNIRVQLFNGILSFGLTIAAVALAINWVVEAVKDLANAMKENDKLEDAFAMIKDITWYIVKMSALLVALVSGLQILSNALGGEKKSLTGPLVGMALMIFAIGFAIKGILFAVGNLIGAISLGNVKPEDLDKVAKMLGTIFAAIGLMVALVFLGLSLVLSSTSSGVQSWAAFAMLMVVFAGIAAIIAEIAFIAGLSGMLFNTEKIILTLSLIGGTLLSIGLMVALIGFGASKIKGESGSLLDVALIMAVVVAGVAIIIYQMTNLMKAMSSMGLEQAQWAIGGMVVAISVFMLGVIAILDVIVKAMNENNSKVTSGDILVIAASLVVVAAAFVVFAKAMEILSGLNISKTAIGLTAAFAALIVILGIFGKKADIANNILRIGLGFAAAGAGFLLFGIGMKALGKGLIVMSAGLKALDKALTASLVVKIVAVLAAVAAVLLPIARILIVILEPLGKIIGNFGSMVFSGGSAIFSTLKGWLTKIPDILGSIIKVTGEVIGKVISTIKDKIKAGIDKLSKWYNSLPTEGKKKIVKILGVLFVTLEAIAPDVVSGLLRVIFKVMDAIADQAEFIANKLIHFLIKVILAFAQAITKNAHIIGNAAKAAGYAILAIISEVLALIFDYFKTIPVLGEAIEFAFGDPAAALREKQKLFSKDIADLTADTKSWIAEFDRQNKQAENSISTNSELVSVIGDYAEKLGLSKDRLEALTDAEKNRNGAVNQQEGSTDKLVSNLSTVERARYNEYEELEKEADNKQKDYEAKVAALDDWTNKYNELIHSEGVDPTQISVAKWNVDRLKEQVSNYEQSAKEARAAADNFLQENEDMLGVVIEAKEKEKAIMEVLTTASAEDIRKGTDQFSKALETQTGMRYDFASIPQAQRDAMLRGSAEIREMYRQAIYDTTIEANQKTIEEEVINPLVDALNISFGNRIDKLLNSKGDSNKKLLQLFGFDTVEDDSKEAGYAAMDSLHSALTDPKEKAKIDEASRNIALDDVIGSQKSALGIKQDASKIYKDSKQYEIGQNIVDGEIGGMDSKGTDLSTFVRKFTQVQVIQTLKDTLGISSPSKVMAEAGKFSILGLIQGLTDNAASLNATSEQIGDTMIVSFGQPFERIAQMASGAIPYNPSITPVLDSSTMASDIYGLNSMFQGQTVSLDGYTGRLAADISGVQNQNEAIVDQLRELRMDMNEMTETILGMQIVLDSGTVIGELSDGMDYSLGVSSIRKKRGN